ncbi:MAG: DUF4382 domain-containing protein [Acidobacteriia bacterium]|nr:DUF4382 domain-containing protein [Terriglobia bacterium]
MRRLILFASLAIILVSALTGCGGGSTNNVAQSQAASVYVTGGDAPLPSVLAFNVTLNSMKLDGATELLAAPTTVDFARLLGLRTLLGFNTVPAGTYKNLTITMASPSISFLDLTATPPSASNITGTFKDTGGNNVPSTTITVALTQPLTVAASGLAGLHLDFNLRNSIAVDAAGQITGVVNPVIKVKPVALSDPDAEVNDLRGGLVSVNTAGNSFILQRVGGHQITIDVNSSTNFSGNLTLATLPNPSVIEVDGHIQADGSVLADSVEVVTTEKAFVSGRIVAVNPATGPVQTVTLLVGEELPDVPGVPVGTVTTLDVSLVSNYSIRLIDNWFTNFLFNNTTLVPGQRIAMGGTIDAATNKFVPSRIVLRRQGVVGDLVLNSVVINNNNAGSLQLQNNNMLGYVLGAPLSVQTANSTHFTDISGLAAIQSGGSMKLATYGLILKDPVSGNPTMYAHRVILLQ